MWRGYRLSINKPHVTMSTTIATKNNTRAVVDGRWDRSTPISCVRNMPRMSTRSDSSSFSIARKGRTSESYDTRLLKQLDFMIDRLDKQREALRKVLVSP